MKNIPALITAILILAATGAAQKNSGPSKNESAPERIAWHGTLDAGLRAGKKTGRPILLVAAAPQCRKIPGIW